MLVQPQGHLQGYLPEPSFWITAGGKAAETAPAKRDSAWILDFDSWAQSSSGYAGVDSEMRMRLKTLYFAANRPTIGALIALGSDVGAAFSSGKPEVQETGQLPLHRLCNSLASVGEGGSVSLLALA